MYRLTQRKGRCVQVSYDNGKTWRSTGCHTKSEARHKLGLGSLDVMNDYCIDFYLRNDEDSFRYRQEARGKVISDHHARTRQFRLEQLILPVFGKMRIVDIKARDIEYWFMRLRTPEGEPYANQTKNDILTVFRQVLDNAMVDGIVNTNEARKIKCYARRTRQMGSLSKKELDLLFPENDSVLLANFRNNVFVTAYFCIFKDTGFRPSEIIALRRSDIKDDMTIYTEWMYDFHAKRLAHRIKTTGHGKDYKVGRITDQTKRIIDMTGTSDYIFMDNLDKFDIHNLNRQFKLTVKKVLDRTDLTQYSMRHAFMTNLIGKYPKELIMELMGHTTWEDCYDDRTPELILENLRKALSRSQA